MATQYTVKFDHSVKYNGVRYRAHVVFPVEEKDIPALKKAGATIVSKPEQEKDKTGTGGTGGTEGLTPEQEAMKAQLMQKTNDEIKQFAADNEVDLGGVTKKEDMVNAIVKASF